MGKENRSNVARGSGDSSVPPRTMIIDDARRGHSTSAVFGAGNKEGQTKVDTSVTSNMDDTAASPSTTNSSASPGQASNENSTFGMTDGTLAVLEGATPGGNGNADPMVSLCIAYRRIVYLLAFHYASLTHAYCMALSCILL